MLVFTKIRYCTAFFSSWLMNLSVFGFSFRKICTPGFNCHGCPWATMACPIGVFTYSSAIHQLPILAVSLILAVGLLLGRLICGFVCPFGFFQDLLSKIPSPKLRLPRFLRYGKYLFLVLLVVALPFFLGFEPSGYLYLAKPQISRNADSGVDVQVQITNIGERTVAKPEIRFVCRRESETGIEYEETRSFPDVQVEPGQTVKLEPVTIPRSLDGIELLVSSPQSRPIQIPRYKMYFCLHCPKGTLTASLPRMFSRAGADGIYDSGWFSLRYAILALFLISAIPISRIFCRVMCPLGAIYAICSKFSAFGKVSVDSDTCIGCGKCDRVCPVRLDVRREAGGMECIACGDCIQVCPVKCISRNRQCQLADSETQQKSPVSINSDKQ